MRTLPKSSLGAYPGQHSFVLNDHSIPPFQLLLRMKATIPERARDRLIYVQAAQLFHGL